MNELVMIKASKLRPHPDNPRKELGDLSELTDSIRQQGILQNLTVVPDTQMSAEGEGYLIVIGHRRYAAGVEAGIEEFPCRIAEMSHQNQVATMLCENLQRRELTVYEQAQGFQMMLDLGVSVSELSDKTGFAPSTIYHRLNIAKLDKDIVQGTQFNLSDYIELEKIDDIERRNQILANYNERTIGAAIANAYREQETKKKVKRIKEKLEEAGLKHRRASFWDSDVDWKIHTYIDMNNDIDDIDRKKLSACEFYHIDQYGNLLIYNIKEKSSDESKQDEKTKKEAELTDCAGKCLKELDAILHKTVTDVEDFKAQALKQEKKMPQKETNAFITEALFIIAVCADDLHTIESRTFDPETYGIEEPDWAFGEYAKYLISMREALNEAITQTPIGYIYEMLILILKHNKDMVRCKNAPACALRESETMLYKSNVTIFEMIIQLLESIGFTTSKDTKDLLSEKHKAFNIIEKLRKEYEEL
ncbi:MAG: ParB/RepB/Spo0J family partition protein [Mogibacterium sp.]|nr:ParB/RepB/Spo0J family partition protein [Mogibacterium sp.]